MQSRNRSIGGTGSVQERNGEPARKRPATPACAKALRPADRLLRVMSRLALPGRAPATAATSWEPPLIRFKGCAVKCDFRGPTLSSRWENRDDLRWSRWRNSLEGRPPGFSRGGPSVPAGLASPRAGARPQKQRASEDTCLQLASRTGRHGNADLRSQPPARGGETRTQPISDQRGRASESSLGAVGRPRGHTAAHRATKPGFVPQATSRGPGIGIRTFCAMVGIHPENRQQVATETTHPISCDPSLTSVRLSSPRRGFSRPRA